MVIHDRSYARWNGSREGPVNAVAVILQAGMRRGVATLFRRKIPAVLLILTAFGPFVFFLIAIYGRYYVLNNAANFGGLAEEMRGSELAQMTTANGETVYTYMFVFQWAFVLVTCVLLGSGLVAEDRRANALELYLARPVTVRQYLLGKLATIGSFIAMVTVLPTMILLLAALSLSWGEPGEAARVLGLMARTVAAGAVWVAVPSMLIVTASCLTERARNAAILWLGVVVMLEFVISNILLEIFDEQSFLLLQPSFSIRQIMTWILGDTVDFNAAVPLWQSVAVLLAWAAFCIPTMLRRVKPVEVVA